MLPPPAQVKACRIVSQALQFIKPKIKQGISERQIATLIKKYLISHGADKLAFPVIVATGRSSASPHHWPTKKIIQVNDMVLIDIGCVVGGLRSDITRTFFVGKPKAIWTKTYLQVLAAQEKALKALKAPTIGGQQLDVVARNYFKRLKLDRHFIHGLGHGIGKWIHQHPKISPKSNATIKPGDVITIEPGLYFSTKGRSASGGKNRFGIRIEDTVVKTKNGFTYLTHFPKDLKSVTIS